MGRIRILLADDHRMLRQGLRALLEKEEEMEVAAEAENGREAVRLAGKLMPDVIVMDISMPDLNGMEAAKKILKERPETRIIALSLHTSRRFVAGMLKAGASGYLLKYDAYEKLLEAIHAVVNGQAYLTPKVAGTVVKDFVEGAGREAPEALDALTSREREVLQLIAEGATSERIASCLCVSVKTVSTHRQRLMAKLKMSSVAELTRFAVREGLVPLE